MLIFIFLAMNVKYCLTINLSCGSDLWGRILIFYQHGMSINRLSIAPGNQTDFPSQAGVVIHRPVPD